MSLHPYAPYPIPEETQRVARAAFPRGNLYMQVADHLGPLYHDGQFTALFPRRGQPAEAPPRKAWCTTPRTDASCWGGRWPGRGTRSPAWRIYTRGWQRSNRPVSSCTAPIFLPCWRRRLARRGSPRPA